MLPDAAQVLTTIEGAGRLGGNAIGLAPWQTFDLHWKSSGNRYTGSPRSRRCRPRPVTGFMLGDSVYISGDTVWFEGVEEIIQRFPQIRTAALFLGAAHVPWSTRILTFTAEEAVRFAQALPEATIVPVHYEGWKHFTESRADIEKRFAAAGLASRLHWLRPGVPTDFNAD